MSDNLTARQKRLWFVEIWLEYRELFKSIVAHTLILGIFFLALGGFTAYTTRLGIPEEDRQVFLKIHLLWRRCFPYNLDSGVRLGTGSIPTQEAQEMSTANSPYSPVQTSSAMPQPMVGYPAEVRFIIYFLILILVLPLALAADLVLHLSTQTVTYGCIALTAILVPASSLAYGRLMARKQAKLERILRLLPPEEMARLQQQLMTPEQMARLQRLLTPEQRARLQQLEHFEQLARQQTLST